jgi:hypothetical protein
MISKEECLPSTIAVVNDKELKTLGSGTSLPTFPFRTTGMRIEEEFYIRPGTKIEIVSKPTKFGGNGNRVKFKVEGNDTILSSWWIIFKSKVNILNSKK